MSNRPTFSFAHFYKKALLGLFFIWMLFGNFSRLIPLGLLPSSVSALELLLYLGSIPLYCAQPRKGHLLAMGIITSSLYGAVLSGFDLISSLYAVKLIGMIAAGVAIANCFATVQELTTDLLRLFWWILGLGFVLFVAFPHAAYFFSYLDNLGIRFLGDPHTRRFISPFFDPNYYAAIACIPLIFAWHRRRYAQIAALLLSIVLTFSRSGIATCALVVLTLLISERRLSGWLFAGLGVSLATCLLVFFFPEELSYLIERTLHLGQDPSALARLWTCEEALPLLGRRPLFGMGYHYLSQEFEALTGRLCPDSSLLMTLIDFGLIPTMALLFGSVWWSLNHLQRRGPIFPFTLYLIICILLTSLFNNLLYYPYWLVLVIALTTRIGGDRYGSRTRPRLADSDGGGRAGLSSPDSNISRPDLHPDHRQ